MPASSVVPARLALFTASAGVLLHVYTALFKADGGISMFLVGLFLASCLPYALAAALVRWSKAAPFALGFALASLAGDLFMHYSVFIAPKGSTAALGLLFMPAWNLFIIGPAGGTVFWLAYRVIRGRRNDFIS
jgi:hypothetical protein